MLCLKNCVLGILISSMIFALTQFAVDDDAKSVPESLEQIGSRLRALESNQTSVSGQLARISSSVNKIMVSQEREYQIHVNTR